MDKPNTRQSFAAAFKTTFNVDLNDWDNRRLVLPEGAALQDGIEIFDYYDTAGEMNGCRIFGVTKIVHDFVASHGFYCEPRDPGTLIFYPQ
jgi:hypothetical protein